MKKNVLLIHCDQLRADCLGFAGNPYVKTPNIDKLAAEGIVLTRHISSNSICMPSRASLLTGLYPPGHGVWNNGVPLTRREYYRPMDFTAWPDMPTNGACEVPTMADMFGQAGYNTAAFGKLHLTPNLAAPEYGFQESWTLWEGDTLDDWHGPYYGFDYVEMTCSHGEEVACHGGHYAKWLEREHPDIAEKARRNYANPDLPISNVYDYYKSAVPSELHNTTWLADQFDTYLDTVGDEKPFFAFVGFPDPHHPFTPSYDVFDMFKDSPVHDFKDPDAGTTGAVNAVADYCKVEPETICHAQDITAIPEESRKDLIRATYAMIYQIDQAVGKIIDSLKRTGAWDNTIIVFTSDHGDYLGDHGLLRKHLYASDPLLNIPCIIRIPGAKNEPNAQQTWNFPNSNCDILPTLASLTGVTPPRNLHGKDLMNIQATGDEHYAFSYMATGKPEEQNFTVYTKDMRLTYYPAIGLGELFDHKSDPAEVNNLFEEPSHQQQVKELMQLIKTNLFESYHPVLSKLGHW